MKRSWTETSLRLLILLAGLTIAHLGVTLFLLTELGADPFNVLVQGIFRFTQKSLGWGFLTHGYTHAAICFIIILALLFIDRSYIKIGTVLCMICGGPIIDFFTGILSPLFLGVASLPLRIGILALGCAILAFGMTIVIKSDAGTGPNDLVAVVLSDKLHRKFGIVRIIVDFSFVLVGYLLGGSIGIGTIICAFLVGPVAGFFMPINGKIVERLVKGLSHGNERAA